MIYFDNAATTLPKPLAVEEAVIQALRTMGNADRGAHAITLSASRIQLEARERLSQLFHGEGAECIAFTKNATEALNIAINGLLTRGDHVITTVCEHNSVLRPLYLQEQKGITIDYLQVDESGILQYEKLEELYRANTKAIIITHASNVTGNVTDLYRVGKFAKQHQIYMIVDAAQTAGILPIDVQHMNIDILCFTGHKGLLGPQGTGGIYVKPGIQIKPSIVGGSGIHSYDKEQPSMMPAVLEAGTSNGHGIAGLCAALAYIDKIGIDTIYQKEIMAASYFYQEIKKINGVIVYGNYDENTMRVPIVSLNVGTCDSGRISDILWEDYKIATRAGAHCAPLMHKALGTDQQGAVRFSFSHYHTKAEIEMAIAAVKELVKEEC